MIFSPKGAGFSGERLRLLSRQMDRHIEAGRYPGLQVTVARHGHVAFRQSFGLTDLGRARSTTEDTIYRIYSMAKPVTAVAFMTLHERGVFQLGDPVSQYVPEWRDQCVWVGDDEAAMVTEPVRRPVTMLDLLRHTAGLTYGEAQHPVDELYRAAGVRDLGNPDDAETFLKKLGGLPLIYHPGERWGYSIATDVCGALVEHFSGMRLGDFLEAEVFRPLGMVDTSFAIEGDRVDRLAACYRKGTGGEFVLTDDPPTTEFRNQGRFQSGGGGLLSTSDDYLRFCEMLRRRGTLDGHRVLGSRTVAFMMQNHLPGGQDLSNLARGMLSGEAGIGIGHGLGFAVRLSDPSKGYLGNGEISWGGAASTFFWLDPREDLIVIAMAQLMPSSAYNLVGELRSIIYAALDH